MPKLGIYRSPCFTGIIPRRPHTEARRYGGHREEEDTHAKNAKNAEEDFKYLPCLVI